MYLLCNGSMEFFHGSTYELIILTALLLEASRLRQLLFRTYRVERHYAVTSGKWYFEFQVLTAGPMRVGWARADCPPGNMLGNDESTWAFDGYNVRLHFSNNLTTSI